MTSDHVIKSIFLIVISCITCRIVSAQQFGAADTSFNYNSAYQSVKKTHPEASVPEINVTDNVTLVENIVYSQVGNINLQLDVFEPKQGEAKRPGILMIFGGGWRSGNRTMHYQMARALAAKGFTVVTPDYRLSTQALYPAAAIDLKTALKWMRANAKRYHINEKEIAAWGFSAGGQLAAFLGTTGNSMLFKTDTYQSYADNLQAVVDVDGILAFIHPESGEGDDSKRTSSATYWFGSGKAVHPELWQQASPLNHVDKRTPPMLFLNSGVARMHAGRDDVIKKLDSLHIYHEMHFFPDSPHPFIMFEPWFTPSLNYTVTFLNRVLS